MIKFRNLFLAAYVLLQTNSFSQTEFRTCASMEVLDRQLKADPALRSNMDQIEQFTNAYIAKQKQSSSLRTAASVTIPVVIHVVYRTNAENISDAQVLSQMEILNKDYAKLNSDTGNIPSVFKAVAANTGIQFCLAQRDPNGNATTGIVRKATASTSFTIDDGVKRSSSGGDDPWDRSKYLNIWVCNLGGGLLGYAQLPGGNALTDGVVILYTAFGNTGVAAAPYNLGRTATHEVGHWLNLYHIWGDASCGNDLVADTPTQQTSNFGCPAFPHATCSNNGDMSMNYMDYTDDKCMYMFTAGQTTRMNALFASGGARASLLTSNGCVPVTQNICYTPASLTASSVTKNSATLTWTAAGTPVSFSIQYKLSTATSWTTVTSSIATVAISGLTPNSTYQFQVQAVCSNGSSTFSPAATFITAADPGSSCVANLFEPNNTMSQLAPVAAGTEVRAMIESSSDIDWYSFSNTSAQPNIQLVLTNLPKDYSLQLYKGGIQLAGSANTGIIDETITYNTTTIGTYWIRIAGNLTNYSNTLCYTLKVTLSGGQPVACGIPSGLSAANVTANAATLTWASLSSAASYNIQYRIAGTSTWTATTSTTTSKTVSGLTANSKYEFQVQAVCTSGTGSFSVSANFNTPAPANTSSSCTVNIFEPNNTMSQLTPIPLNAEVNAMIESASDIDWYVFSNSALQSNIQVRLYNLPKDYSLKLYKAGVELVSSMNTGTADELISYNTVVAGTYWIRVAGSSANYSNTQCYTLKAITSGPAFADHSVNNVSEERLSGNNRSFQIYPNPSSGDFSINYTSNTQRQVFVRVLDLSGNELYFTRFTAEEGENSFNINLFDVANGLYLIDINDGTDRAIQKIMINK